MVGVGGVQKIGNFLWTSQIDDPLSTFCDWLQVFVTNNSVDIILGDFNTNAFNENIRLSHILSPYDQLVNT